MSDYGDQVCEAAAKFLNAQDFTFRFTAVAPEDPVEELNLDPAAEPEFYQGVKVFLVPSAVVETRLGRGDSLAVRPTTDLYVTRFLEDDVGRKEVGDLFRQVRNSLVGETLEGWRWESQEVISPWDPVLLRTQKRFVGLARVVWQNFLGT